MAAVYGTVLYRIVRPENFYFEYYAQLLSTIIHVTNYVEYFSGWFAEKFVFDHIYC